MHVNLQKTGKIIENKETWPLILNANQLINILLIGVWEDANLLTSGQLSNPSLQIKVAYT